MKKIIIIITILLIVGIALGYYLTKNKKSENKEQEISFLPNQSKFSNKEITDAAYSDYKYPEAFYKEDLGEGITNRKQAASEKSVSLDYVNAVTKIDLPIKEGDRWFEVCTNDKKQALEWSEYSRKKNDEQQALKWSEWSKSSPNNKNKTYYSNLIDERETEKFFEFKIIYSKYPSGEGIRLSRIRKCSYLDRSKYPLTKESTVLGIFNQRPVTTENVKELIEYLWFIAPYDSQVLSSFSKDQGNSVKHIIYKIEMSGGDWGMCDRISLIKYIYVVDKISGEISFSKEDAKTVQGQCISNPKIN